MDPKELILGLRYASIHSLSPNELIVLIPFLKNPLTSEEASVKTGKNMNTVYHIIQRLKLKGILRLGDKTETGAHVYYFVDETLEGI